jgi:hypothetical protein
MPQFDRFFIAPFQSGYQTDVRPWLLPEDAFAQLNNCYVYHGRVIKRFGGVLMGSGADSTLTQQLFSRLRVQIGTITTGALTVTVPGNRFEAGQQFSILDEIFTVPTTGTPVVMLTTGATTTHTYNTSTGQVVFSGSPAPDTTPVWWYPADPVMGLTVYEVGATNNQPTYAFDQQFAYVFNNGYWQRSSTGGNPVFRGTNSQFFWTTNWEGATPNVKVMFVTNFNASLPNPAVTDDPMYTNNNGTWATFTPYFLPAGGATSTGPYVTTCRIILPFKGRLLLLNTVENNNTGMPTINTQYGARCRYSWYGSPFATQAWYEPNQEDNVPNVAAGGGFVDAATDEVIIGAEFIKDRLIVWFEQSVWELAYTGNEIQPFIWQKLNTEYGSQSTFSTIPFDRQILAIGENGIHACNGSNVERIDQKIPKWVFNIRNTNSGIYRVNGIRDYYQQCCYWTYPDTTQPANATFNNKVLLYNYENNTWAENDDCITCFGVFEQTTSLTWATWTETWAESGWSWSSGSEQSNFRQVIAGNQQGFTFVVNPDCSRNAPVMQISSITVTAPGTLTLKIYNHTLTDSTFIAIENAQGVTNLNNQSYFVTYVDTNTIEIIEPLGFSGTYTGGGLATRISQIQILSKQWNPYVTGDRNFYLHKIDFGVEKTSLGEIELDYYPSYTNLSMVSAAASTNCLIGSGILETTPYSAVPLEQMQTQLWHPMYLQTEGESIQIYLYLGLFQLATLGIAWERFMLHGMILYTTRTSQRLQ